MTSYINNKPSNQEFVAKVNIWDTNPREGRCGHASVSLIKNNEPTGKSQSYMGMWPKFGILVNPLTLFIPSPGVSLKSKKECMEREGDEAPLKPSRVYYINLSKEEYDSMEEVMNKQQRKIDNHTTLYTLFPQLNLMGFAKNLVKPAIMEKVHACPFSDMPMEHPTLIDDCQGIKKIETENCTTIAVKILQAGNIPVHTAYTPWGLSPTGLGNQLDNISKTYSNVVSK